MQFRPRGGDSVQSYDLSFWPGPSPATLRLDTGTHFYDRTTESLGKTGAHRALLCRHIRRWLILKALETVYRPDQKPELKANSKAWQKDLCDLGQYRKYDTMKVKCSKAQAFTKPFLQPVATADIGNQSCTQSLPYNNYYLFA